jgi:hypothetical protein
MVYVWCNCGLACGIISVLVWDAERGVCMSVCLHVDCVHCDGILVTPSSCQFPFNCMLPQLTCISSGLGYSILGGISGIIVINHYSLRYKFFI